MIDGVPPQSVFQYQLSSIVYSPERGLVLTGRALNLPERLQKDRSFSDLNLDRGFRNIVAVRGGGQQAIEATLIEIARAFHVENYLLLASPNGEVVIKAL